MKGRALRRMALVVLAAVSLAGFVTPDAKSQSADFPVAGGWFFTQTGGDTPDPLDGYAVLDDSDVLFWTAFRQFGGIQSVGYPVSRRFRWDGFVTQVFQKAAFQWRADTARVEFINVFDDLNRLGFDDALESRLIPPQEQFDEEGLSFDEISERRIALMDAEPALRASYESVADPLRWFGLPQSRVREYGDGLLRTIRLQRAVLQLWTEDVPWADAGAVTVANGGEEAKALGLWPENAVLPGQPPEIATERAVEGHSGDGDSRLLWEYPLPEHNYPHSHYRVVIDEGVAIVRLGDSEIRALDVRSGQLLWGVADPGVRSNFKYEISSGVVYLRKYSEPRPANGRPTPITEVMALDLRTGEKFWHFREISSQWFQRIHIWQNILVIAAYPRIGLDLATGRKLWEARTPGFTKRPSDGVWLSEHLGLVTAIDLTSGATVWQKQFSGLRQLQGPSAGNVVAESGDSIVAFSAKTGEPSWSFRFPGMDVRIHFLFEGVAVVHTFEPHIPGTYPTFPHPEGFCVLEMGSGNVLWCEDLEGYSARIWPGVGGLRLESGNRVVLVEAGSGMELWTRDTEPGSVRRGPQFIRRANIIYEVLDGEVAAFDGDLSSRLWQYSWTWDDDPDKLSDDPLLMTAADNIVIIWTGSGLAAVGIP